MCMRSATSSKLGRLGINGAGGGPGWRGKLGTYRLGYENVFLEEGEPRELLDDGRPVARRHEVDRGLHRRACGGGV